MAGANSGAGHFYHRTDLNMETCICFIKDFFNNPLGVGTEEFQFTGCNYNGDHYLGINRDFLFDTFNGRARDRLNLHVINIGIGDRKTASPVPQHGICLDKAVNLRL